MTRAKTTESTTTDPALVGALQWTSPENKLWVATRDGEFAGFIEYCDGHYAIVDRTGLSLQPRATLSAAQGALESAGPDLARSGPARALISVALGSGAMALSWLALALGVIRS